MAFPPTAHPPLPPACTECVNTLQLAQPGAQPQSLPFKLARSADGKMRIDSGTTSVITDPKMQQMTVLDHVTKEVRTLPMPKPEPPKVPGLSIPGAPGMPGAPPMPPGVTAKDLGKRMIEGVEAEGRQFTIPGAPQMPKPPAVPGAPGAPQAPGLPKPPAAPTISEVWTSTALKLPVVSRVAGPFGKQTCICKNTVAGEPHPSLFQIPPGYKILPSPPKAP